MNDQKKTIEPVQLLKLAYFIIAMSFWFLFAVTFVPLPDSGQDNAKYIVGFLVGTGLTSIISFYFRRQSEDPKRTPNERATDRETTT
jgi:hypothetical protein